MSNVKCVVSATSFEKFVEQLKGKARIGYTNVIRATYKDGHFVAALGEHVGYPGGSPATIDFLNGVDSSTTNVHAINKFLKDVVIGNEVVDDDPNSVVLPVDVLPSQADVMLEEIVAVATEGNGESEQEVDSVSPKKRQRKNKKENV